MKYIKNFRFLIVLKICLSSFFCFSQTATSFNVGGDIDKFYPVTFKDANWPLSKETEMSIGRSYTHLDADWRGSLMSSFKFHTFMWGNGSSYINVFIKSSQVFIAGWQDASSSNGSGEIVVWLKGGGTTYLLNSSATIGYVVYDGTQHALPFAEENGPQHTFKTTEDSYVSSYQQYLAAGLAVEGSLHTKGNVGIGTSTPQATLDVQGDAIINGPVGSTLTLQKISNNNPAITFKGLASFSVLEGGDDRFSVWVGNDYRLSVLKNGNVGIGTTTPGQKLSVLGNISANGGSNEGGALFLENSFKTANNVAHRWALYNMTGPYGNSLQFWNYSQDDSFYGSRFTITDNGNVGVGTSTPENEEGWEKVLDVHGNSHAKALVSTNSITTGLWSHNLGYYGALAGGMVGTNSNHPFSILTNKTAKLTILANGDIGIGTTTPKEKLSVNGKIRAHEIKVETTNWPDYVFEEDYQVGTLEALESYIKTNKHLPEMPSAKEVETNGIALGEMNKLLLKKVEELTLYLIEKDKQIFSLMNRVDTLESKTKK